MAQRLREATRGFQLGRRPMMLLGLLIGILLMMGIYGWLGPSAETPSAPNTETETASPRKPAASVAAASAPEGAPDDGGISQQYAPAPSARPRPVPPRPSELPCTAGKATERLYTGERLEEDAGSDGHCPLEIDNGTDGDAVIRVVEGGTNQTVRLFYVRSGESYKLRNIEPGDYEVMWETGNGWVSFCKTFAHDVGYSRFRTPLSFTMGWSEKQERPYCDGTGVTLYEVPEGNIKKKVISRNEFLRGDPYLSTGQ
ncbi:MAG TPA: hypothetical protein VMW54_02415 [Terriglobia bacterium]|nr:hypothetical protein [Terriglobia bacterium]